MVVLLMSKLTVLFFSTYVMLFLIKINEDSIKKLRPKVILK